MNVFKYLLYRTYEAVGSVASALQNVLVSYCPSIVEEDDESLVVGVLQRNEWIRINAYYRWLNGGCQDGRSLEYWLAAQDDLALLSADPDDEDEEDDFDDEEYDIDDDDDDDDDYEDDEEAAPVVFLDALFRYSNSN
jgi:hypothetical protein